MHQTIFLNSHFLFHQALRWLDEVAVPRFSEVFRKLTGKNSVMKFIFSNAAGLSTAKDIFLINFWNRKRK